MATSFNINEKIEFELKGNSNGILLNYVLQHTTANTAFSGTLLNTQIPNIKIVKLVNGSEKVIYNGPLLYPIYATNYQKSSFRFYAGNQWQILTAAASGVKERVLIPLRINFPPLSASGNETIQVTMQQPSNFADSTCDTSASFVYVSGNPCQEPETLTTNFELYPINPNQSSKTLDLGKGVVGIFFINLDKTTVYEASQVIQDVSVSSDTLNITKDYYELLNDRFEEMPNGIIDSNSGVRGVPAYSYQSMNLLPDVPQLPLNNVSLSLSLNSANVNSDKCKIFVIKLLAFERNILKANQELGLQTAQFAQTVKTIA